MSKECLFKDHLATCKGDSDANYSEISQQRMISVGEASRIRGYTLYQTLTESILGKHFAHKNCLSTYTSNNHIQRHLKRIKKDSGKTPEKRTKISRQPLQWNRQCLFCGKECLIEVDRKNPQPWRESFECRTSDRDKGKLSLKEVILQVRKSVITWMLILRFDT